MTDIVAKLERLKALKDQGAMDESEYRVAKAQILSASSGEASSSQTTPQPLDEAASEWEDRPAPFWKRLLLGIVTVGPLLAISMWFGVKVAPTLLGGIPSDVQKQCVGIGPSGITVASFNQPMKVFFAGLQAEKMSLAEWQNKGDGLYALSAEKGDPLRNKTDKLTFLFREKQGGGSSTCGPNTYLLEGVAENDVPTENFVTVAWYIMGRGSVALGIKAGELKTPDEKKQEESEAKPVSSETTDMSVQNMEEQADELDARADEVSANAANEALQRNNPKDISSDVDALWKRNQDREKPTAEMRPQFAQYRTVIFPHSGGYANPILTGGNRDNREYKTAIRDSLNHDPQFAGKYNIARLGCGNMCEYVKFINLENGKITDLPSFLQPNGHDLISESNSRLLKVVTFLDMDQAKCRFTDLVMENDKFTTLSDKSGPCP
ncbi:SHOCT domain-containing protein [Sphingomonas parapaucimobilis]|uniref:SHOCT domain-containing protein n=1 Tax=Sphingomonas parapaucimobilis TaxID=28213 RepID=UPI0039199359